MGDGENKSVNASVKLLIKYSVSDNYGKQQSY